MHNAGDTKLARPQRGPQSTRSVAARAACRVLLISLVWPVAAAANDTAAPVPWREVWTGADVTSNTWLVYSGVTLSPFSHIHDDGLRFRFTTGYGEYDYSGLRCAHNGVLIQTSALPCPSNATNVSFSGVTSYADILIGYLKRIGELTAKAFVGAAYISHSIGPFDPDNEVQTAEWGVKGGVELWLNIGETAWTSLDSSYTTAHDTFSVRSRFGYRVLPTLSIGPEAGINGNAEDTSGRGGLFARYDYLGGEISASGGVSGDIADPANPYATVNWMTRF